MAKNASREAGKRQIIIASFQRLWVCSVSE